MFSGAELQLIADLCIRHNCLALLDEVYEHLVFPGGLHHPIVAMRCAGVRHPAPTLSVMQFRWARSIWDCIGTLPPPSHACALPHLAGTEHISLRSLPGMADRCLRIGSAGKTFSFTAWKVGRADAS